MGKGPFKMKGSPMQRNFGIGEKESPLNLAAWVVPALTKAIPYAVGAAVTGATSAGVAVAKGKEQKRKEDEEKKQLALKEAAEGIGGTDISGKTKIA